MATVYSDSQFRTIFQTPFNLAVWTDILRVFFKAKELKVTPEAVATTDAAISGYYLGNIDTIDCYRIGLFHYDIKRGSVANKLVGLRNLVRTFINPNWGEFDVALVTFDSGDHWRLSFISDIKGEETHPSRYSYVFGNPELRYNTPLERFALLIKEGITFSALRKAFSVEALSDKFFDAYREHYADFVQYVTGKRFVKVGSKWEERTVSEPCVSLYQAFGEDDKKVRDYIKKMLGRITFLHFLQRKGWMNGDLNYMQNLFEKSTQKENFLEAVLEPLFFGILNTKPEQRQKLFEDKNWDLSLLEEWRAIPYLNGGLFEQDEEDEPESIFPAELFSKLFNFFGEYNFTIDENDPRDAEIGVDPEMLGKIFENLLEDNKDKGAFYTPKEIVQYMCQDALISYLQDNTTIAVDKIEKFVLSPEENATLISNSQQSQLLRVLKNVKICDPAIGSGAFPMGLLNVLIKCRLAINPENDGVSLSELKKSIICNNIYGVDIEKGAVDIARLRFWLSIVVEENRATPLPNLDYKIMQGNSLVESFNGVDLSSLTYAPKHKKDDYHPAFWEDTCIGWQKSVSLLLSEYYSCFDHEVKYEKQKQIQELVYKQLKAKQIKDSIIDSLKKTDISATNKFFLWHTWFSEVFSREESKRGFDIVIGNPPYVDSEEMVKKMPIERELYSKSFKCAKGNWDLYIPFLEKSYSLLNSTGSMVMITPNKWLSIPYGKAIRKLLYKSITSISDFSTFNVFESANVSTVSTLVKKKEQKFVSITKFNLGYVKTSKYNIDKKGIENFDNLGLCLSNNVILLQKLLMNPLLSDSYVTQGAATVSETYEIADIIEEYTSKMDNNSFFKVLNTGTICKFDTLWGKSKMTYVKRKYIAPVVRKNALERSFPKRFWQAASPKLITKGIRYFDVVGDFDGEYLAAKSTVIILPKGENKLQTLLAILNSSVVFFFLKEAYGGLAMDGGITFTADNVGRIPIPYLSEEQQEELSMLVNKCNKKFDESMQDELDELVYRIYGLTEKDITLIESFKKQSKRKS